MGNFPDHSDRVLFFVLVAVVACLFLPGIRRTGAPKVMGLLAVFFALLYLVVPRVAFATWFIFERAAYLALAFAVAAAPVPRPSFLRGVRPVAAVLALATAVNIGVHFARVPDERDADAILDHIPEGAKVVGLMYNPAPWPQLERATWVHFQSYHLARHQGETTPSFLFIESLPVHYKPEHRPPRAPAGTEWSPEAYTLDSALAAHFTTVLVRAPWDTPDPTFKVFGAAGADVNILAHEGRFWLYDTKELLRRRGADVDPFE
jgi:hypothetical protein